MKIKLSKLGVIETAEFELGDITIICGENNTGKTYATYATYGFLDFWNTGFSIPVENSLIEQLLRERSVEINATDYHTKLDSFVAEACRQYSKLIPEVFAGSKKLFGEASLKIEPDNSDASTALGLDLEFSVLDAGSAVGIKAHFENNILVITLPPVNQDGTNRQLPQRLLSDMVGDIIKRSVFGPVFPKPFIASVERTGSAIFQKELDFTRNRIVEMLGNKSDELHPLHFLGRFKADYPVPVRKNVDFIRELPNLVNRESYIQKEHPEILERFSGIIGGEYKVSKDGEVHFMPAGQRGVKLALVESSSAVRSMLDIGFYLRHLARKGDLLIIDEPELNLHPKNQRRVARLITSLANIGIKVMITTHSDYIIKEINTLIMLNAGTDKTEKICEHYGYKACELISPDKVHTYIAQAALIANGGKRRVTRNTLVPAEITAEFGIDAPSFDSTIDEMNEIQDRILWG